MKNSYQDTPVTDTPKEATGYFVTLDNGKIACREWDGEKWDKQFLGSPKVVSWLRPVPDQMDFAKWCAINGWYYILNEGWSKDLRNALCSPELTIFKTDDEIIEIYYQQTGIQQVSQQ